MLGKEENDFIRYWEKNRLRQKKLFRQFLVGIPLGLLFVIPTVISFTSGWYKRADMEANSGEFNPMVLFVALLLIVGFTAIFYQRWKWDQYEQRYRELLAKRDRDTRPPLPPTQSDPEFQPRASPSPPMLSDPESQPPVSPSPPTPSPEPGNAGTDAEPRSSETKK